MRRFSTSHLSDTRFRSIFRAARFGGRTRCPHCGNARKLWHLDDGRWRCQRCRKRDAPLDPDEALRLARQVASALDYAHRAGVVHRDIKPENILFAEGLAVVADFGVARAVSTVDRQTLTRSGFPVGTLGYMSPEQAAGRTDLDERTDVFSLACVV